MFHLHPYHLANLDIENNLKQNRHIFIFFCKEDIFIDVWPLLLRFLMLDESLNIGFMQLI